jgi:hypothetical protein
MTAFGLVTLRAAENGRWWALNKRETGWRSFGYVADFLGDLLDEFGITLVGFGRDETGLYLTAMPNEKSAERVARVLTNVPSPSAGVS